MQSDRNDSSSFRVQALLHGGLSMTKKSISNFLQGNQNPFAI